MEIVAVAESPAKRPPLCTEGRVDVVDQIQKTPGLKSPLKKNKKKHQKTLLTFPLKNLL